MSRYAEKTKVPISRSRAEVERILSNAGADELVMASSARQGVEMVQFALDERTVSLRVQIPQDDQQEHRRRWRSLVLILKAKLEMIASGDSTVDREFMADLLLADGTTVGEVLLPQVAKAYELNGPPVLMLGAGP